MPKRSAQEKLDKYRYKIRKLEEKVKEKNWRRKHCRLVEHFYKKNLESGLTASQLRLQLHIIVCETILTLKGLYVLYTYITVRPLKYRIFTDTCDVEPRELERGSSEATPALQDVPDLLEEEVVLPAEATAEISLDPELLSALGSSTSGTPDFGEDVHESLAGLWTPLLKKGLVKDDKDRLMKEHLIPANCKPLQAPKLNAEISAAVSDIVRGRDKKLVGFQQQLGNGTAAINKAMDVLLKSDNKILVLKYLTDGCRLLSDLHHCLTKDRIKLITPSLEKNFLNVIQDSERDETLYGNSLSEKIKASKAIEKRGSQIKKTSVNPKGRTPQTSVTQFSAQKNWSGPPRYPSNRGGRGGQRRPPGAPRRSYQSLPQVQTRTSYAKTRASQQK
ncbi:uncharacterized protein LOC120623526 [Pararge aegeria]|uniref:uncharacterized protein LOC120623526 n=1 Tax=Pararge aegeria TaxID=116150 RepID=UPI0019CFA2FF|nr:uncharacterized protein LOC120623526 [Pararge aegeria]